MADPRDMILGEIQVAASKAMGSSAGAMMRQAGLKASHKIWPELPAGLSVEEAGKIMREGISGIKGFGSFSACEEDGLVKIAFSDCYFASLSADSGQPCGQQPICYFGFGLVEETLARLTGKRTKVELISRDEANGVCHETATPR
ncbi:hypothetical protein CSA37_13350 [Candidatus Fermentibacteria bacterium]|nr:MAG: hypothetical protein CSA37_13350 [Candidatus Fermentibacteria bacterium]